MGNLLRQAGRRMPAHDRDYSAFFFGRGGPSTGGSDFT
jgi:hypothetical protein